MSKQEIEIKLQFSSKSAVLSAMKANGAKYVGKTTLSDRYYSQDRQDMDNAKHGLLRIRQHGKESQVTYKGKIMGKGDVWKRIELDVAIDDPETMAEILAALQFRKVRENESLRETWALKRCQVIFITFRKPAPLTLLEVEGPSQQDVSKVVALLGKTVRDLDPDAFSRFDKKPTA